MYSLKERITQLHKKIFCIFRDIRSDGERFLTVLARRLVVDSHLMPSFSKHQLNLHLQLTSASKRVANLLLNF